MAGILIKEEDIPLLEKLGVKDSKLLTKEKREELFNQIKDLAVNHKIISLTPEQIDQNLKHPSSNLNWLEANTSVTILNQLKPDQAILDCPSPNVAAYLTYVLSRLNQEVKTNTDIIAEHKADENHLVVAAASILAKVTRDRELEKLKKKHNLDFGSGYLTDELTQEFLKNNFQNKKYEKIFRKKWQPFQELVKNKEQKKLGDF